MMIREGFTKHVKIIKLESKKLQNTTYV